MLGFFRQNLISSRLQSLLILLIAGALFAVPFMTLAAIGISAINVSNITATTATVSWRSSVAGDSWVGYTAAGATQKLSRSSTLSTLDHSIQLTGLIPGTKYTFEVNTQSLAGDVGYVLGNSFTTTTTPGGGIPCGTLAKSGSAIYFLTGKDAVKVPFTSMAAFTGLGYSLKNVKTMDVFAYRSSGSYYLSSPTQEHPWCSWMKWKDGTIYYSHPSGAIPVPSWDVFLNNGGRADLIVPMNAADDAIWAQHPNLPPLQMGDSRIL